MDSLKSFVENNFNTVLLISIVFGLIFEQLQHLPDYVVIVLIGIMIFFSCSDVSAYEVKSINKKHFIIFYFVRYLLLPIVFYYVSLFIVPKYALGILLVCLIPAGITSTALVNIMKGNTSFAFTVTIVTSALAPFMIPFFVTFLSDKSLSVNSINMFMTLCYAVFIPSALYFFIITKTTKVKRWIKDKSKMVPILLMGFVISILISSQRHYFFENIEVVIFSVFLGCILYTLLYLVGWIYALPLSFKEKKTYAICSGANNLGLAAGLALLYFSPLIILFTALAEVSWVLILAVFKFFVDYKGKMHE